jgi:hypothetical protein
MVYGPENEEGCGGGGAWGGCVGGARSWAAAAAWAALGNEGRREWVQARQALVPRPRSISIPARARVPCAPSTIASAEVK